MIFFMVTSYAICEGELLTSHLTCVCSRSDRLRPCKIDGCRWHSVCERARLRTAAMDFQHPAAGTFRFGVFELDARSGDLRRHGQKVRLPHQSFQILLLLLSRPGDVVTRDELRQALWTSETFVDFDVGLNSAIRKLREALDDDAGHPSFIETLPRRGYRFIAPVNSIDAIEPVAPQPAPAIGTGLPPAPLPMPRRRIRPSG